MISKTHTSVLHQTVGLVSALIRQSVHHALQCEELNPENYKIIKQIH